MTFSDKLSQKAEELRGKALEAIAKATDDPNRTGDGRADRERSDQSPRSDRPRDDRPRADRPRDDEPVRTRQSYPADEPTDRTAPPQRDRHDQERAAVADRPDTARDTHRADAVRGDSRADSVRADRLPDAVRTDSRADAVHADPRADSRADSVRADRRPDDVRTDRRADSVRTDRRADSARADGARAGTGADHRQGDEHARLLPAERLKDYTARWQGVKNDFVDEPRRAVDEADRIVADQIAELQEVLNRQRHGIGHGLDGGHTDTEDLRVAMNHYRTLFERLISL